MGAHGGGKPVDKAGTAQAAGHHHQGCQVNQGIPGAGVFGDIFPTDHVQGKHQRYRQQTHRSRIHDFTAEHPQAQAE
ncbi:hypothetical protein D3C80_1621280 [compost metagenome]